MITFLDITNSDAIRGVLGLAEEELPDAVMTSVELADQLQLDVENWLPATIATVVAEGTGGSPTAEQLKKYKALKLHTQYRGAILLFSHVRSGTAAEVTDGQNAFKRRANDLKALLPELQSLAEKYQTMLMELYNVTVSSAPAMAAKASPDYDPVTNEST